MCPTTMDKFMQQMREAFANEALWKEFQTGIWDTIYSTVAATLVACVLGIILGIILVAGEEDGVRPLPGPVMKVLNFAINILRSVPFLILLIMVLPLSELLVGTTIGTVASILKLKAVGDFLHILDSHVLIQPHMVDLLLLERWVSQFRS